MAVKLSDAVTLPVQVGASLRHRRFFHPTGVLAQGTIERTAPDGDGLPIRSCEIVGRVSKGIGLPGSLPDIVGLAWRMPPQLSGTPWDILLASTFAGQRILLCPATSWRNVTLSSLMPLKYEDTHWWLRARLTTRFDGGGLALASVDDQLGRTGLEFELEQAPGTEGFRPLARIALRKKVPHGRDVPFDPALHIVPGVSLTPHWLAEFRRAAYERSRTGRGAE